jgi:hypothetical protein
VFEGEDEIFPLSADEHVGKKTGAEKRLDMNIIPDKHLGENLIAEKNGDLIDLKRSLQILSQNRRRIKAIKVPSWGGQIGESLLEEGDIAMFKKFQSVMLEHDTKFVRNYNEVIFRKLVLPTLSGILRT